MISLKWQKSSLLGRKVPIYSNKSFALSHTRCCWSWEENWSISTNPLHYSLHTITFLMLLAVGYFIILNSHEQTMPLTWLLFSQGCMQGGGGGCGSWTPPPNDPRFWWFFAEKKITDSKAIFGYFRLTHCTILHLEAFERHFSSRGRVEAIFPNFENPKPPMTYFCVRYCLLSSQFQSGKYWHVPNHRNGGICQIQSATA